MTTSVSEIIVEIVSDSGEGAQSAGQMLGTVSAQMGNHVWTVEIIPAEIEPPKRSAQGASGNRIRIGSNPITNVGNAADIVVAFNEQVLHSRIIAGAFRKGTVVIVESKWSQDASHAIQDSYREAIAQLKDLEYDVIEINMDEQCRKFVADPRKGKNMWVSGMLAVILGRDLDLYHQQIQKKFARKGEKVVNANLQLLNAGADFAKENIKLRYEVPKAAAKKDMVVMNGNQALALGAMAAGFEICSMYPITPATSASHHLASVFNKTGGFVHQAEDEIAAIGFAIGASYAGKAALTITSGPGMALKTEFIGLACMAEVPLVIVDVQRGGPSTGLPTRVEQSDLLATLFGSPGDSPKIVLAASTIEECYHFMILARKIADAFRTPVFLLTDANLATGQQPFPKPEVHLEDFAPPFSREPWDSERKPFDWSSETGLSIRPIPGQKNGMFVLTGLAHDESSKIAYDSHTNQRGHERRSQKLHTFQKTLNPPNIFGDNQGDLLIVGWGSTRGAIEESVEKLRSEGHKVSAMHLRFLSPLEPGLKDIFGRFKKVMTVEINYSDPADADIHAESRRYAQLAFYLRAQTLVDVDCWSRVIGVPLSPTMIYDAITTKYI